MIVSTATERCRLYRRRILEISQQVPALHVAPAFSCIEMVDAIYHNLMNDNDIFIMSKGHGCLAQYVVLEQQSVITRKDMDQYCKPGGLLGAHPDYNPALGIEASTGSLGHGLAIAIGQAHAERLKGSDAIVYCILSDGECQEGSTWEAMMMASNLALTNLIVLVDNNDYGGLESLSAHFRGFDSLAQKTAAFGWITEQVDGHDSAQLVERMTQLVRFMPIHHNPALIICETIKGKGVSFMEGVPIWHYRSPNPEEFEKAMRELE